MTSRPRLTQVECFAILRMDFLSFIERSFYELNPQRNLILGPYIDLLASKLKKCRMGLVKRLIINLPPRTLKSHAASVALPAWLLGHGPSALAIWRSLRTDPHEMNLNWSDGMPDALE